MKRFYLTELAPESTPELPIPKTVAEGIEFFDGTCVLRWISIFPSTDIYDSIESIINIHHVNEGIRRLVWVDE